eukprot:2995159-Rhodomonas_salina.2
MGFRSATKAHAHCHTGHPPTHRDQSADRALSGLNLAEIRTESHSFCAEFSRDPHRITLFLC